jgi:hypothetical protein
MYICGAFRLAYVRMYIYIYIYMYIYKRSIANPHSHIYIAYASKTSWMQVFLVSLSMCMVMFEGRIYFSEHVCGRVCRRHAGEDEYPTTSAVRDADGESVVVNFPMELDEADYVRRVSRTCIHTSPRLNACACSGCSLMMRKCGHDHVTACACLGTCSHARMSVRNASDDVSCDMCA